MVVTRSRLAIQGDEAEEKTARRRSGATRRNFVITIGPKTTRKKAPPAVRVQDRDDDDEEEEDDDGDEEKSSSSSGRVADDDDDDDEDQEEEFDLPESVLGNPELRGMADRVIEGIRKKSPTLEAILKAEVREKHRAELFEWFMIYENSMPMSEDRMVLRKQLHRMLENYKKEFIEFNKHKEDVVQFEENHENHNDMSDLQFAIMRLETTEAHKQVLFRKYSELTEREDMDEEFYKLKGWLKQALQLPFDRIKNFPRFDNVTEQLLHVKNIFDTELYGMDKVKEQLLLFIHGKIMNPDMRGCCLGLVGEPGVGKCLHPMTPVMLLDGSVRPAHTLTAGEVLMGDDSEPRVIESVCTGTQLMYRIVQENGDPYTVNSSHILTLYHTKSGELRDISISDFVRFPKRQRDEYLGVKTGVRFPSRKLSFPLIPVRMMGYLWASQSSTRPNRFTVTEGLVGLPSYVSVEEEGVISVTDPAVSLFLEKHLRSMPVEFRINSQETRLDFLRGVVDACGLCYDSTTFYIYLPAPRRNDLLYLTRSLGLLSHKTENQSVTVCDPRGIIRDNNTVDEKALLVTYGLEVQKLDVQPYVGFIVDGNHRFLLGDFTITHNTSIARCLAKVLDFPFEQISFGGVHHSDFIKGFDFTYVGSRPGEIARCLTRMGHKNGIIFFDEYEKVSDNPEITSTLLHITDFSQNSGFRDNFFNDLTIDLSSVWFIYSMNELPQDKALKDRIYSIVVEGYSEKEKVRIASDYLFPKNLVNIGKTKADVVVSDDVVGHLVRRVCGGEKGIRNLEKAVRDVLNKVYFLVTNQDRLPCSFMLPASCFPLAFPVVLTEKMVDVFLKGFSTTPPPPSFYA